MLPSTHLFSPHRLSMIDGSSSFVITEQITLDVSFSNGDTHTITFYVAPLDSSCEAMLGLDWLVTYNPLVDWTTCLLTFRKAEQTSTKTPHATVSPHPLDKDSIAARTAILSTPSIPLTTTANSPCITFVNAIAFY